MPLIHSALFIKGDNHKIKTPNSLSGELGAITQIDQLLNRYVLLNLTGSVKVRINPIWNLSI